MKKKNNIKILDLFCGAGGFSEGFQNAGYSIVGGIDIDNSALETYKANFPNAIGLQKDLSSNDNVDLDVLANKKIDVIIGGPPCQGFSVAGKRLKNDPRNVLYRAYLNLIDRYQPKAIVIENVPSIMSLYNGEIAKQLVEDLQSYNYQIKTFKLIASDYGVPQLRKRIFFIGILKKNTFEFSQKLLQQSIITTKMALSDLPLLNSSHGEPILQYPRPPQNDYQKKMRDKSMHIYNHEAVVHNSRTIETIKLVPDGGNYKDLPSHLQRTRKVNIAWTRMNSKKPCFTIDAGHNHHFHYKAHRVPTVRECARIQSFGDKFIFSGTRTSQYRQVGNAVPPLLAEYIGRELSEHLGA